VRKRVEMSRKTPVAATDHVNLDATTEPDQGRNLDAGKGRNVTKKPRSRKRYNRREVITAYVFIAPALLGFGVFFLAPALRAIQISFTNWDLLSPAKAVGFANYRTMWHDPDWWHSVRVTATYVVLNIPLQTVIGLFLATAMSRLARSAVLRSVLILPYLLSNVIAAMVWLWLLDPTLGFVNQILRGAHLPTGGFFGEIGQALPAVAWVNVWRHMGYTALLFYAGMQSIPSSVYEAARIDGANEWTMFRRITLPLLRPVLAFVMITSVVGSFQVFDTVIVVARGVPLRSIQTIVYYINDNAFAKFNMGYASSLSVTLFAFLIVVSLFGMRITNSDKSDLG
jgi:multiple sugar transport system permease protein